MRELTEQQKIFCREYASNGGNGADAARKAGFSERSAGKYAYQLLEKTHVLAAVQREQRRAFTELASIALGQVRALLLDGKTPVNARIELAKMSFDRAGLAAIPAEEESGRLDEIGSKDLRHLSADELERMAAQYLSSRAIPITPGRAVTYSQAPAPEQPEPVTVDGASVLQQAPGIESLQ
ncbi:MAG: terminase small subunit [Reyranellaceae bacterium]